MTDRNPQTDLSEFHVEFERDKGIALAQVRDQVGWPEDPEDADQFPSVDQMWDYITALENTIAAEYRVRRMGLR